MTDVEKNITNILKLSLKKQTHGNNSTNDNNNAEIDRSATRMLRVKYEYHNQIRSLSLCRPVKFEELYQKIYSSLGVHGGLVLHYINANKEIFGQISNQSELDQIIQCVDRNIKYHSLRILVTAVLPQRVSSISLSDCSASKQCGSIPVPDSPPPGSLHPNDIHMERSTSFPISHVDGEFIPEDDVTSDSQSGDSSYSSLLDSNWGGGSGRRSKFPNLTSHSEIFDNGRAGSNQTKIGTFPLRINPSQYVKPEGKLTLPHLRNSGDAYHRISSGHDSSSTSSNLSSEFDAMQHSYLNKTMTRARTPSLTDFKKGPLLGRGGFGQVYKCLDSQTGREFAMKEVMLTSVSSYNNEAINKDAECLENEILIYRGLTCHQRIVQYFGMKRESHAMFIFMEYMAGGSVKDQLRQYGPLSHNIIIRYCKQILQGLAFLHQKMIIHRDIKAANILRDIDGNVKLSDFGASRYLKSISIHSGNQNNVSKNSTDSSTDASKSDINKKMGAVNSFCGTFFWMAPEVIRGESYSISADIWSMGATVVEMLTGNPPYHDMEPYAALFRIANTNKVEFKSPVPLSNDFQLFIDQMFISTPSERATAETLLACHFISAASSD